MSIIKETARRQYVRLLDQAAQKTNSFNNPKQGWIATMRKALGITAPQLARRMNITKPAIYQAQRQELNGGITLKQLEKLAKAMGGRLTYAIVPENSVQDILQNQARNKAEEIVKRASAQMALEQQSLRPDQIGIEINQLADQLLRDRPSDFWD